MRVNVIRFIAAGIALLGVAAYYSLASRPAPVPQDDPVLDSIAHLSSRDERVRQAAKDKIVQFGATATKPLITFLEKLVRYPRNRYESGTSEDEFDQARESAERTSQSNTKQRREAAGQLSTTVINQRLKEDGCELLGRLRAEAAVPALIEAMESWPGGDSWENSNAAMDALEKIGRTAIPDILEAIESAKLRAARPQGGDHPSDFYVKAEAAKNQARASMVLAAIGDASASPALERLEKSTDSQWLVPYLRRAIVRIRARQN